MAAFTWKAGILRKRSELPLSARCVEEPCPLWAGTSHWPPEVTRNFAADVLPHRRKAALSPNQPRRNESI